jgi:hypothetical protein
MLARVIADLLKRLRKAASGRGRATIAVSSELREVRLRSCSVIGDCGGACCARGVRIDKPEAERLAAFVREHPDHFRHLADPEHALVPLDVLGTPHLWHTEVVTPGGVGRDGLYRAITTGATVAAADQEGGHCVFKLPDGRCSFQVAAVALGHHKWEYKPTACWLFPLRYTTKMGESGVSSYQIDWIGSVQEKLAQYPCSRRTLEGAPADVVLKEEIEYFIAKFGPGAGRKP